MIENRNTHQIPLVNTPPNLNVNDKPDLELNKLRIYHWNCNSLMGKRTYIKEFLRVEKPHLLFLNEIKCKNEEEANLFSRFDNYLPKYRIRK